MATARDLVQASLRKIGVLAGGEDAAYHDAADALSELNRMVDGWPLERLNIYTTTRSTVAIAASDGEYPIGLGPSETAPYAESFDSTWGSSPPGWTLSATAGETCTNDTTFSQAGGHSMKMLGTGVTFTTYRDFVCKTGEYRTISLYLAAAAIGAGGVLVHCIETNNELNPDGTWEPNGGGLLFWGSDAATFVLNSLTFRTETAAIVGADTCTLRVTFKQTSGINALWIDTFSFAAAGYISVPRPVNADGLSVYLIDTSADPDFEYPLTKLTEDGYAAISEKARTDTQPSCWYYNPTYPYGTLHVWPVPTGSTLSLAVYIPTQVSQFSTLSDTVSLPNGYEDYIVTNLALRLCPDYNRTPNPLLIKAAAEAKAAVKRANRRDADLSFESASLIGNRGYYNIRGGP